MRPARRRNKKPADRRPTGPGEQIFVSLVVILLGGGFCLIPLIFGWNTTINYRGNRGPGAAASFILGSLFIIFGLVGLCLGVYKSLTGRFK